MIRISPALLHRTPDAAELTPEIIRVPASLQEDLLRYAADNGRTAGMIFTKKKGTPLNGGR